MKACTKCKQEKALDQFRPDPRYRGGYTTWCIACLRAARLAHYAANREAVRAQNAAWYAGNRERALAKSREWYRANATERAAQIEARRRKYIEQDRERKRNYRRRVLATSPEARLRSRVSSQIRYALNTGKGGATWASLLGYSAADLRAHLERQFLPGMGWHNLNKWHIDHIVPLAAFPRPLDLRAAWALPNLRPLWREENIRKREKRTHLL